MRRSCDGGRPYSRRIESLNRRTLRNPDASATRFIGRSVSWISCRANCRRVVCTTAIGDAPRCAWKSRSRWRGPTPRRRASAARLCRCGAPSVIRRRARLTVADAPFQAGVPGAASGRQRRHARKPAATASSPVTGNSGRSRAAPGAMGRWAGNRCRSKNGDVKLSVEPRIASQTRPVADPRVQLDRPASESLASASRRERTSPLPISGRHFRT